MLRRFLGRLFGRGDEPPDARPPWMHDEQFMAWLAETKPGDYKVVMGFGPAQWMDLERGLWGGPTSYAGATIQRCQWRWEGWKGAMVALPELVFVPHDGPPPWWQSRRFVTWHDEAWPAAPSSQLPGEPAGARATADVLITSPEPAAVERTYKATKALRRRYQGWCGILQLRSGRIVCPNCGSWDVDNVGDTVVALCGRCGHEWHATWPSEAQ